MSIIRSERDVKALEKIKRGESHLVVKVTCWKCGRSCGPLPLDGKPYICGGQGGCGAPLFGPVK